MQLHKILNEKKDSQKSIDIMAAVNAKGGGVSGGIPTNGSREGELAAKKELAKKHRDEGGTNKTLFDTPLAPRDAKVGGVPPPRRKRLPKGVLGEEKKMTPEEVEAANHKSATLAMGGLPVPGKKTRELIIKGGKRRGKIPSEPDTDIDEGRDPNSLHKLLEFNMDKGRTNKSELNAAAIRSEGGTAHRKGRIAVGTARFNRESDLLSGERKGPKVHNRSNFNMSPEDRLAYVAAKGKHQSGTKAAQGFATKRKAKANANESTQYPNLHKLLEAKRYSAAEIASGARTYPSGNSTGGSKANRRGDRAIGLLRMQTGSEERGVHPSSDGERTAKGRAEGNYESGKIMARAHGRMRKRLSGGAKNESTQYPNLHNLLETRWEAVMDS